MAGPDSYTKLLLHMNDVGLTDSSTSAHTINVNGTSARSATQSKFGGYSAIFNGGSSDYLSSPDSPDWNILGDDLTIDFWVYFTDTADTQVIVSQGVDPNHTFYLAKNSVQKWQIYWRDTTLATYASSLTDSAWDVSPNTWYHIAFVITGSTFYTFINGQSQALTSNITYNGFNLAAELQIGSYYYNAVSWPTTNWKLNGYLDELRISKGIARWTSNFTPPTRQYATDYYALSGTTSESSRVLIVDEDTWTTESTGVYNGSYDITTTSGSKLVIGRKNDGESIGYGSVSSILVEGEN